MSDVVALLLDDAMPPERLGALLRSARKRSGMKRKQAAAAAGTTATALRSYERGEATIPADVCAQLAECYGDDLTAHVPLRMPLLIEGQRLKVGGIQQPLGPSGDDVITGYIDIVHRLRKTGPGEALPLRTADIIALAGALGRDRDAIESRIAEVLGCTPYEARRLHGELLRRKVILPVAGLAAGMAAFAGAAGATQTSAAPGTHINTQAIVASAPSTTAPTAPVVTHHVIAPTTTVPTTTPTTTAPTTTAPTIPAPHVVTPTTAAPHVTDATVPVSDQQVDPPATVANPQPDPNDPPVSVLPGETPITIIGTPDSVAQNP